MRVIRALKPLMGKSFVVFCLGLIFNTTILGQDTITLINFFTLEHPAEAAKLKAEQAKTALQQIPYCGNKTRQWQKSHRKFKRELLHDYNIYATLDVALDSQQYNCLTGTILYSFWAEYNAVGKVKPMISTNHAYVQVQNNNQQTIDIELTVKKVNRFNYSDSASLHQLNTLPHQIDTDFEPADINGLYIQYLKNLIVIKRDAGETEAAMALLKRLKSIEP